jgi:hypothetical protein
MLRKTGFRLLCLAAMVSFFFIAQAQTEEQGWKKTLTLPSGEVVCDLNGEWDLLWTGRGEAVRMGRVQVPLKIIQQGNSFKGIRMKSNVYAREGSVAIEGELNKDGFEKLIFNSPNQQGTYKGKLSKDGNLIEFTTTWGYVEVTRR